jgi:3-oxoisoapionate kinase
VSGLLLSFYGDDFTGSTDAMESLALGGVRTVLFTQPPTPAQLARFDGLRAFGVAGMTRAMTPQQMEHTLRPAFAAMKECGAPIVHYKVCSTFDSSPTIGSIGRAIDIGAEVFGKGAVPVVVGAPALGRYCVFGNLFVRNAGDAEPMRIDRHPSMSRHPTTPMIEADLRVHLARQTSKSIGLIDVTQLDADGGGSELGDVKSEVVLIDLLDERQLATIGGRISRSAFVVGSSGVESALMAHWKAERKAFPPVAPAGPILAVCGSCSPISARQVDWAIANGFADASDGLDSATRAIRLGRSAVVHTRRGRPDEGFGKSVRDVIEATKVRRVLVAGGDTSGQIARALDIESLEMIGELARGSPLCRGNASGSPADGIEITFKGGQIGPENFFGLVRDGSAQHG